MKIRTNTPEALELMLAIPRFLVWLMVGPFIVIGATGISGLFSEDTVSGSMIPLGIGIIGVVGYYLLSRSTCMHIIRNEGIVRIRRSSLLETTEQDYALEHLQGAEVDVGQTLKRKRAAGVVTLLFSNTRPATTVPLTGWGLSGSGPGMIANTINDWLSAYRKQSGDVTEPR